MAVKVIDEGPDKSVIKQVIYTRCGCKLEYIPLDVKSRTFDGDTNHFIICPKCQKEIKVAYPSGY
jgi:hypothetical protein